MEVEPDYGGWILHELIGKGLCGIVRKAYRSEDSDDRAAVKIIDISKLQKIYTIYGVELKDICASLHREGKILSHLRHSNIVYLKDSFMLQNSVFLFMELVIGIDLLSSIPEGGLPQDRCRDYFFQLCSALDYCHSRRVIHGDVKPENILIRTSDSKLKLIDFGFAQIDEGEPLVAIGGTTVYSPPCDERITFGLDDWAAGVVLYAMSCQALPFQKDQLQSQKDLTLLVPAWICDGILVILSYLLDTHLERRKTVGWVLRNSKWLAPEREKAPFLPSSFACIPLGESMDEKMPILRQPSNTPLERTEKPWKPFRFFASNKKVVKQEEKKRKEGRGVKDGKETEKKAKARRTPPLPSKKHFETKELPVKSRTPEPKRRREKQRSETEIPTKKIPPVHHQQQHHHQHQEDYVKTPRSARERRQTREIGQKTREIAGSDPNLCEKEKKKGRRKRESEREREGEREREREKKELKRDRERKRERKPSRSPPTENCKMREKKIERKETADSLVILGPGADLVMVGRNLMLTQSSPTFQSLSSSSFICAPSDDEEED